MSFAGKTVNTEEPMGADSREIWVWIGSFFRQQTAGTVFKTDASGRETKGRCGVSGIKRKNSRLRGCVKPAEIFSIIYQMNKEEELIGEFMIKNNLQGKQFMLS